MVNGVVLLDKPSGITSRQVTESLKQKLGAKKAGNTGVLDPNSTGVLVICLDEATKAMPLLMGLNKEYVAKMRLHKNIDKNQVIICLKGFVGKVKQVPPVKSSVARKERERVIHSIDVVLVSERDVEFKIRCEAGFYIRKFIHDVGQKLGCGAQMVGLRRTAVDKINVSQCVGFDDINKRAILNLEDVLEMVGIKKICIKSDFLNDIKNGKFVAKKHIEKIYGDLKTGDVIGIFVGQRIAAIGKVIKTKPDIYIKPDRVFKLYNF